MGNFDESDVQKAYAWAEGKNEKTVTIASILRHIVRKIQAQTKTVSPPGIKIAPDKYLSITSGLTQEAAEDEYSSLLDKESLSLDPERDII